jgi:Trypsin-co-occurring domain 2
VSDGAMSGDDAPDGWVDLSSAIEALRNDLARAWWDGKDQRVRFKVEPVELTLQAGVTKKGTVQAGVKWHILTLGGEKSRENAVTQTLKLKLAPVFYDKDGKPVPDTEAVISGPDVFAEGSGSPRDELGGH